MGLLRVAIIGLGPKGLAALERLLDHASALKAGRRLHVDVFESHEAPGAGPNYDPGQPSYLLMNFAAEAVDMWWPTSTVVPAGQRLSYRGWRARRPTVGDFPPRADVGRYLQDGLETILRHTPPGVRVALPAVRADNVRRHGEQWEIVAGGTTRRYDEVLLATGHATAWDAGLACGWSHAAALVPAVFPVGRRLAASCVAPGTTVAVRGFALTFIDAALALTEGRGGSFEPLDHPYRLRYVPADEDVRVILPFSRTGRTMLAKPGPGLAAQASGLAAIADEGRSRLLALPADVDVRRDLPAIIADCASASLLAVRGADAETTAAVAALRAGLEATVTGAAPEPDDAPATTLERSLAVSAGVRPPDEAWALGHSWRALYPALVSRLGGDGLDERQWPLFRTLAAEMERVAFGPAPLNVAKLLALVDAGRVDLTHVRDPRVTTRGDRTLLCSECGDVEIDVVIDAVLPGPGACAPHDEPLRSLIEAGHARVARGRRGLDVTGDGACRGRGGDLTPGLTAIGRCTEDVVIGNDTLSRTLHPLADNWARRIVRRCHDEAGMGRTDPRPAGVR